MREGNSVQFDPRRDDLRSRVPGDVELERGLRRRVPDLLTVEAVPREVALEGLAQDRIERLFLRVGRDDRVEDVDDHYPKLPCGVGDPGRELEEGRRGGPGPGQDLEVAFVAVELLREGHLEEILFPEEKRRPVLLDQRLQELAGQRDPLRVLVLQTALLLMPSVGLIR